MAWSVGDILWTTVVIFVWAALIWMFIGVFADILRRHDLSGVAKAGWLLVIVVLPLLGILIYLISRPASTDREPPPAGEGAPVAYTRLAAADEIEKAGKLLAAGAITQAEFEAIREQALARAAGT
jgi:predicted membrane channel-forming protein YqfA (hemolysin III family)